MLDSGAEGPGSNRSRIAVGNSLRQTVHTHCASVHQAAKLVAAHLRVAGVTAAWRKVMTAYCQAYDSCQLQVDYQKWDQLWNPMLGNEYGKTLPFFTIG